MGLGLRGSGAGRTWGLILALFLAVVVYWLPLEGLTPAGHKALALLQGSSSSIYPKRFPWPLPAWRSFLWPYCGGLRRLELPCVLLPLP